VERIVSVDAVLRNYLFKKLFISWLLILQIYFLPKTLTWQLAKEFPILLL
jgi:hypothetical protein